MHAEEIREYCLSKKMVTESFPFDEVTLVFKVADKMFALLNVESQSELSINLKCNPEKAIELREQYSFIIPGFHMNKKHWNTVLLDSTANRELIFQLIDDSYNLVVGGLSKKQRIDMNL